MSNLPMIDLELSELISEESVLDAEWLDDGVRVRAENLGPAPNAIEVFADHTDTHDVRVEIEEDGWTGYRITRRSER